MEPVYLVTESQLEAIMKKVLDEYRKGDQDVKTCVAEQYLSGKQVCQELNISSRTFQRYRDQHRIPFIQRGRKIYVKRSDLDTFQDANRIEAN